MIASYSQKKMILLMKDGNTIEFTEPHQLGVSDVLAKHQVDINQVQDIKIEEGRLEDAFSKMVAL
jgi:hypothetical protein